MVQLVVKGKQGQRYARRGLEIAVLTSVHNWQRLVAPIRLGIYIQTFPCRVKNQC